LTGTGTEENPQEVRNMARITKAEAERQKAVEDLKRYLKPGDTVYTSIVYVARSGMARWIRLYVFRANHQKECAPVNITWDAAIATTYKYDTGYDALRVDGCGTDVGFEAVYTMSRAMWPHGYTCSGEKRCHSNDHTNGDRNYKRHLHHDGGYALSQRWQ
jgi:hypothetical protein